MSKAAGDGGQDSVVLRSGWWATLWPALLIGGLIFASALAVGQILRDREARALSVATATAAEGVLGEIEQGVRVQIRAIERLAAGWVRRGGLPRAEFEAEAEALARDFSGLHGVGWVDPGFYVRWMVPRAGNEAARDVDLAFEARRREALEAARDERATIVSRPIQLVQEGLGFIVYVPLYVGGRFDGFVGGVWRAEELFSALLRNVTPGFAVRIRDEGELLFERGVSDVAWAGDHAARSGRNPRPWSIEVAPRPEVIDAYQTWMPLVVTLAGVGFALGFAITAQLARSRRIRNRELDAEVKRRQDAERELSSVIQELPDHVWSGELTRDGWKITYYSPVIARITGRPVYAFANALDAFYEIVHEADLEMLRRAHAELLTGQRDRFEIEYRIYRPDGTLRWLRDRVHATLTKRGMRLDGVVSDITETKRVEAERLQGQQEKLLLLERERMTREMHDGLGGQLASIIAMLEMGRSRSSEVAEALRRALDDMRIVVDSLDPMTTDLPTSLGKLRARIQPLLLRNGLALDWQVEEVPGLDVFSPEQTLHFLRIIQEAVTNALLHAKAGTVSVHVRAAGASAEELLVEIRDDGCGFRPDDVSGGGRGLRHMKARAEALGATLRFGDLVSGTCIALRVPIPR